MKGATRPRLWTPPLRKLSRATSKGYRVIDFAESLGIGLMPWQRFALVHGLELRKGGGYRFRIVLIICSRQNGKTTIPKLLSLWRMLHDGGQMVLGTSTNLEYARESWEAAAELAEDVLPDQVQRIRRGSINTSIELTNRARYKIAAANRSGGRSLSVDLGVTDELREHASWDAWAALSGTTTARPDPQIWALSNAGDDSSVVLNHLRESALGYIDSGVGDDALGLFEWSAPDGCDLDDRRAWAQANPALGERITDETLTSKLHSAPPAVFRTEHLCQRVANLDPAVDASAWSDTADPAATLDGLRDRLALCVDVAIDLKHVSLLAAAVGDDGRARVEVVAAWDSVDAARSDLAGIDERVRPRMLGWFPGGPAASLAVDLRKLPRAEEIRAEIPAVCQGFSELVSARQVLHNGDPMLAAQIRGAGKVFAGDAWRFTRRDAGHVDGVYAAAGAVHLARQVRPRRRGRVIVPSNAAA